jgi:hypothetical protein
LLLDLKHLNPSPINPNIQKQVPANAKHHHMTDAVSFAGYGTRLKYVYPEDNNNIYE